LAARPRDFRPSSPPKPHKAENKQGRFEAVESPATVEEELELLWAFASIKNAAVRKSLIDFVVELVKSENPR
jgi:hypothetical protein